jgi:hypothetical protein
MKRFFIVLVDSHAGPHSQPATEGGRNGIWPMPSSSQVQELVWTPTPVVRRVPARNTSGDLTMSGRSRFA